MTVDGCWLIIAFLVGVAWLLGTWQCRYPQGRVGQPPSRPPFTASCARTPQTIVRPVTKSLPVV